MKTQINRILNFIKPKKMTRIYMQGVLFKEFESEEPKEINFVMDARAELLTFRHSENENT